VSPAFAALGVDFDLTDSLRQSDPKIIVRNKVTRIEEICQDIDSYFETGSMTPSQATTLRGRLVFSNSQTYGRKGALAYYHLGLIANMPGNPWIPLGTKLRWPLQWWKEQVAGCKPRTIRTGQQRSPLYLFTDGSCDPDETSPTGIKAAYGAVLYDPEDSTLETFGRDIGPELLRILSGHGAKQQIVGQSELLPCHAARTIWKERLQNRRIVLYVDNEAARFGLIKGTRPTLDSAWIINEYWTAEAENETTTWVDRVPSASNCADGPSRGRFDILTGTPLTIRQIEAPAPYEKNLVEQWHQREPGFPPLSRCKRP